MTEPSFEILVPVHNPPPVFAACLEALRELAAASNARLILVDDGIDERTRKLIDGGYGERLETSKRGAAAALQVGLESASAEWIVQIDQDVVVGLGFVEALLESLDDESVAAVQGWYLAPPGARRFSRWAAWDLDDRWRQDLSSVAVDHVCTGVTLYRRVALEAVGGFPVALGYGYDSELSARLIEAGWSLRRCREAIAIHDFPDHPAASFRQHFGQGYGRLEMVAARSDRSRGDQVSSFAMILHAAGSAVASALLLAAALSSPWWPQLARISGATGALLVLVVLGANAFAALREAHRNREVARLGLFVFRSWRDLAWAWACWRFVFDRLRGHRGPQRSMPRRP